MNNNTFNNTGNIFQKFVILYTGYVLTEHEIQNGTFL